VTLHCDSDGTYPLNLVDASEDLLNGSTLIDTNGPVSTNVTPDGEQTVTCGGGGPPVATPTSQLPTPSTPSPPGTLPPPPVVPPGMEALPLVEGCQYLAWTGADGTAPGQLATQVSPPESLAALWAQQPPPTWKGYSPEFPQVSDLEPVNMLDVVAFCMTGPGYFLRPLI
jgi:hypothetical protein